MHNRHGLDLWLLIVALAGSIMSAFAAERETPLRTLDRVWQTARENIYPESLTRRFTDQRYEELVASAAGAADIYELTPVINRFLESLNVSHTRFFNDREPEFYMFRSLFTTREINIPPVRHIGAQYSQIDGGYVIREVLDGYPAATAGLRRGDVIEKAEGVPFAPIEPFNTSDRDVVRISVRRGEIIRIVPVRPVLENPHQGFLNAMQNGHRSIDISGRRVGYVHLWSGTHISILRAFEKIILDRLIRHDGLILDLRGGYGGAWHDYLDPFFADRSEYFLAMVVNRDGRTRMPPKQKVNARHFSGPMVVLINEGTRSGKEALAYQFKKTGRATLIGTTTAGAFTGGMGLFTEEETPYFLYLAVGETLLDGHIIEGVGVSPDIEVRYPLSEPTEEDPQFSAAIAHFEEMYQH